MIQFLSKTHTSRDYIYSVKFNPRTLNIKEVGERLGWRLRFCLGGGVPAWTHGGEKGVENRGPWGQSVVPSNAS